MLFTVLYHAEALGCVSDCGQNERTLAEATAVLEWHTMAVKSSTSLSTIKMERKHHAAEADITEPSLTKALWLVLSHTALARLGSEAMLFPVWRTVLVLTPFFAQYHMMSPVSRQLTVDKMPVQSTSVTLLIMDQAKYPQRKTLAASSSRALTLHTRLQSGRSAREFSSLLSAFGLTEPELGLVRQQSRAAMLLHRDSGPRSESGLGSEVIWGAVRSIRGSWLCLDHQVSRYRGGGQADSSDDQAGERQQDESKVQVVDIGQDSRPPVWLTTGGRCIGELQNHADQSHQQATHQTPECTLRNTHTTFQNKCSCLLHSVTLKGHASPTERLTWEQCSADHPWHDDEEHWQHFEHHVASTVRPNSRPGQGRSPDTGSLNRRKASLRGRWQ
ncbi:hypothetical protein FQN60_013251, partial [Etheostoma spectabile]